MVDSTVRLHQVVGGGPEDVAVAMSVLMVVEHRPHGGHHPQGEQEAQAEGASSLAPLQQILGTLAPPAGDRDKGRRDETRVRERGSRKIEIQ